MKILDEFIGLDNQETEDVGDSLFEVMKKTKYYNSDEKVVEVDWVKRGKISPVKN